MDTHSNMARFVTGPGFAVFAAASVATDNRQSDPLLNPSQAQLDAEARGAVLIYDGLEAGQVAEAMDREFERIQHMMFVRIHHLPPPGAGGEIEVEDDDCD